MTQTVAIPLWLFVLILLFAVVTFASHFLFPSVRWFFRRRMQKVVGKLNQRLERPIEPFKLARRYDMIQRSALPLPSTPRPKVSLKTWRLSRPNAMPARLCPA